MVKMAVSINLLTFIFLNAHLVHCIQPYNETLARMMTVLSAAAYSTTPDECVRHHFEKAQVVKRFEVRCDASENSTCSGYLALLHELKVVAVAFRGTASSAQFYNEIISSVFTQQNFFGMGRVNYYFHRAYLSLWLAGMRDQFRELVDQFADYRVWVTGHSLGAAMATLCTADLVSSGRFGPHNSLHYNFGSPRVGDVKFTKTFEKLLPDYYRVVHAQDVITTVYPTFLGYAHHHTMIWYNNSMTDGQDFVRCYGDQDPACPIVYDLDMTDHRYYFDVRVPDYGRHGCQQRLF